MIIRRFRPDDLERLYRIDNICFPKGIAYTRLELKFYVSSRRAITLVAEQEAEILGFIIAHVEPGGIGHIVTIDILPEHRRIGLGGKLLMEAEDALGEAGATEVRLETAVDNIPAIAFYLKHGYRIVRRLPGYYKKIDAYEMRKKLPSRYT